MNGGESGSKKELFNSWNYIQYEVSVQLQAFVCMNHYFYRLLISS